MDRRRAGALTRARRLAQILPADEGKNIMTEQPAPKPADPRDVGSPEQIVAALYDVISGPAGKKRDWDRMRSLFIPGARLIPTGPQRPPDTPPDAPARGDEEWAATVHDVEAYIERGDKYFAEHGFFEREIASRAERFGHIVHVFSTFDSRHEADDPEPFARGINSIQLMSDGRRWWVVTIFWEAETPQNPIPEKYLTSAP